MRKSGMSLVTVVVAVVISALVMTGILRVLNMGFKGQQAIDQKDALRGIMLRAGYVLRDTAHCTASLIDRTFDSNPSTLSTQTIPNASDAANLVIHPSGDPTPILQAGLSVAGGLTISKLSLQHFLKISATQYLADLEVEAVSGKLPISRSIPLKLTTASVSGTVQKIVNCENIDTNTAAATASPRRTACGITPTSYRGDLGGYAGAKTKCEAVCGPGADMCDDYEAIRSYSQMPSIMGAAPGSWIVGGCFLSANVFTCHGYTDNSSSSKGCAILGPTGPFMAQPCDSHFPILCCK